MVISVLLVCSSFIVIVSAMIFLLRLIAFLCGCNNPHLPSLQDKHVVITGGSTGIGFALAKECLSQGALVTLIARNSARLSEAARVLAASFDHLPRPGDRILIKAVDVSDADAVAATLNESFKWKPIDVLICNAGVAIPGALDTVKVSELDMVSKINLMGSVYPVHAVLPLLKARSKHMPCSIVFMSSLAGLLFVSLEDMYTSTKYALRGLAEVLRFELMPYNIKVNLVCPGFTDTPLLCHESKEVAKAFERANKILFYDREKAEPAETVAKRTMEGVKKGQFLITSGASGMLLAVLTRGFVPAETLTEALMELFLLVPMRLLSFFWLAYAKRTNRRHHVEDDFCRINVTSKNS